MKILFHLAHPAQYHMFKYVIKNLKNKGHYIKITINTKDILENLLILEGVQYTNILRKRRKSNTKFLSFLSLLKKDLGILFFQIRENFDLLVGTESALSHVGWIFRKPVLIMAEDDVSVIPEAAKVSFPFATYIISPFTCNLGKWSKKKIAYSGFQKTAYLHPAYFKPQEEIVKKFLNKKEKYFLLRISDLSAYHDKGIKGFTEDIIRKIIEMLLPYGEILISTERQLPEDLQQYLFKIKVTDIHHFIYYADLLIADSQSMCVEAAILGTPSIRFNDFVGKIGVLEELEHKYGLTFGIRITEPNELYSKINDLLKIEDLRTLWHSKRDEMLKQKIDVTSFWTWLIDSFPESVEKLKKDPDIQYIFRHSLPK